MTHLPIIIAPDPILKAKAKPVARVDARVRQLLDDMLETMYADRGIGLAAPQVGISERLVVIDTAHEDEPATPLFLVNPEILWRSPETTICNEGCLSLPEYFADITRAEQVRVRYTDRDDKTQDITADGMLAICLQHEIDHLEGKLFVDYLSPMKRSIILRKLRRFKSGEGK
ncbi:MAG: peptide deformylase [Alphaproteobacteria bacterium GWF2_58_20]|nr:MAG: peptide deformylase [Alphaproteobacteria bacterium GWF2_58_20]